MNPCRNLCIHRGPSIDNVFFCAQALQGVRPNVWPQCGHSLGTAEVLCHVEGTKRRQRRRHVLSRRLMGRRPGAQN